MVWQQIKRTLGGNWQGDIVKSIKPFTMTSDTNIMGLIRAVRYIERKKLPGAVVECGVWKGGSMMAVAKTLVHLGSIDRELFLFDTFDDFPSPGTMDVSHDGKTGAEVIKNLSGSEQDWRAPSIEEVRKNLHSTSYPDERLHFIKGDVLGTLPAGAPLDIALLRLDTDWYQSTLHELQVLYPRLVNGAVLIIDDYGYWKGCKKAVDEFFETNKIDPQLVQLDFSSRLHYKKA